MHIEEKDLSADDEGPSGEVFRISFRELIGKQLKLEGEPLETNRAFLKALVELNVGTTHFDTLSSPELGRQTNAEMTTSRFTEIMNEDSLVDLEVGDWYLQRYLFGEIRFVVRGTYDPKAPGNEQFFWFHAELNEENFQTVSQEFGRIYGRDLNQIAREPR